MPAIPREFRRDLDDDIIIFTYYYDDSNEEFITVCPHNDISLHMFHEQSIQRKWRKKDYIMNSGSVLFPNSKHEIESECKKLATPTIMKTQDICSPSNDVFYDAGYSVK